MTLATPPTLAAVRTLSASVLSLGCLLAASVVHAAPLGLNSEKPDVLAGNVEFSYDSVADAFEIHDAGGTFQLTVASGGPSYLIDNPTYDVQAIIDGNGDLQGAGTLNIVGGIDELGIADGSTLVTASLDRFGFAPVNSFVTLIEFAGAVTGQHVQFQNNGWFDSTELGLIFTAFTTDGAGNTQPTPVPTFGASFQGVGNADNFEISDVPTPGAGLLFVAGGLALWGNRRKSAK